MKKVLIIGNFGAKNLGDELILASALAQYPQAVVMTSNAKYSQKFVGREFQTTEFFPSGVRSFFKFCFDKKFRCAILSLENQDFEKVVFPGGGLFAIKTRAVVLWTIIFLWAKYFLRKPIYFQSAGVDAGMNFFAKFLIKFVFQRADFTSARDEKSAKFLSQVSKRKIENIGDGAENLIKSQVSESKKEKILCLNARAPFDFTSILQDPKFKDYRKVFVAFEFSDLSFAPQNIKIVFPETMEELFDLFSSAEIAIGERLHFLIVSVLFCGNENVFTPRKSYSEKVANFCEKNEVSVFE